MNSERVVLRDERLHGKQHMDDHVRALSVGNACRAHRQGVLCLISALSFHELTTQVPHTIDIALERGTRKPRLDYPPTRFFWFSGPAFREGIETHTLDGVPVRIYDPEKTLADCFRYRNQIGMDVVLEALRLWRERRRKKLDVLLKYAQDVTPRVP